MHVRWDVVGNSEHVPCSPRPEGGCSLVLQKFKVHMYILCVLHRFIKDKKRRLFLSCNTYFSPP